MSYSRVIEKDETRKMKKTTIWKVCLLAGAMLLPANIAAHPMDVLAEEDAEQLDEYYTIEQKNTPTECLINDSINFNDLGITTVHRIVRVDVITEDNIEKENITELNAQTEQDIRYSVDYDTKIWTKVHESENGLPTLKRTSGKNAEVTVIAEKNFGDEENPDWIGVAYKTYKFKQETRQKETVDVSKFDMPFVYELKGNRQDRGFIYTDGEPLTVTLAPEEEFPENVTVEWSISPVNENDVAMNQTAVNQAQIKWIGSGTRNMDSLDLTAILKVDGEQAVRRTETIAVSDVSVQKEEEKKDDLIKKPDQDKQEKQDKKEEQKQGEIQDKKGTENTKETKDQELTERQSPETENRKPTIRLTVSQLPLQAKKTVQLSRIITDVAEGDYIVSCTSSKPKIATVNRKGKVTAKRAGTSVITIRMASGATAKVTIRVQKKAVSVTSIKNISKTWKARPGEKKQLKPVLNPVTASQKVTYQSSNKKVAVVSKNGLIKAKKAGTAKITVKAGKKKCTITVKVAKRK